MLFILIIPYEFEFQMVVNFSVFNVTSMLIVSLWHIFKSDDRNPAILLLWIFMLVLFPVLILFVPSLMARWGGFIFAIVVVLWDLGIFIVIFIIFIYLVNSRKKMSRETEVKKSHAEEKRAKDDSGMKTGAVIINNCAQLLLILSLLGLTWNNLVDGFLMSLISIISILILLGSIYTLYSNKYFSFGSIICVVGGVSMILYPFYYDFIHEFTFHFIIDIITITLGALPIIGVIIHHLGKKVGSVFCITMGCVNFVASFLFVYSGIGGGFLAIFPSIQFEPILMIIGGYYLYQEQLRN